MKELLRDLASQSPFLDELCEFLEEEGLLPQFLERIGLRSNILLPRPNPKSKIDPRTFTLTELKEVALKSQLPAGVAVSPLDVRDFPYYLSDHEKLAHRLARYMPEIYEIKSHVLPKHYQKHANEYLRRKYAPDYSCEEEEEPESDYD